MFLPKLRSTLWGTAADKLVLIKGSFDFYLTPSRGRVYKWKFCPFVCPSSLQTIFLFLIQILAHATSPTGVPQSTLVTQPLPRYPMSPIHVSHARQSTGPPMNRIILRTLLAQFGLIIIFYSDCYHIINFGVELSVNLTFFSLSACERLRGDRMGEGCFFSHLLQLAIKEGSS